MLVMSRKNIVSILTTVLVFTSVFIVGCGEVDDDTEAEFVVNSQPSIGAIPDQTVDVGGTVNEPPPIIVNNQPSIDALADQTVYVGDTVEVEVRITDPDRDDEHTISATSNDTDVATVSVTETTLSVEGIAAGTAIIEVTATDDSDQDNAAAIPVTFTFTVIVNNQPSIDAIADQIVDAGDTVEVEVRITDPDRDDEHIISATSNDTDVATVSVVETTLSVEGIAAGTAVIEVVATDNSGQDNAAAMPVTFNLTVTNFCKVGDVLQPGDSCKDGTGDDFTVLENGRGRYLGDRVIFLAGNGINMFGTINGKRRSFSAAKKADGSWEIKSVTPKE